jgi:hypothetical protein
MSFTGKATYSAGPTLPEIAEDVADIVSIVSPYETALLDHLGDPQRAAKSTIHEWLEDELLPNTDAIAHPALNDAGADTTELRVAHIDRYRTGDQVRIDRTAEVLLVTGTSTPTTTITVVRGYGGTTPQPIEDGDDLRILGNAALEGADRPVTRFTNRMRRRNYTQIFTAAVEVSGSQLAATGIGVRDEIDYQKQERLRELVRDLENCVINGVSGDTNPQGDSSTRRTMQGLLATITSNAFKPGEGPLPVGDGDSMKLLNEPMLSAALREVWQRSSGSIDTIVVNGFQKRRINSFITGARSFGPSDERYRDLVSMYESDFGVCRVVLSRWAPADSILLLDSSRIDVLPLSGRSFHYKPLAAGGDAEVGQLIGEYTLEVRNELAHAVISGLATTY